MEPRSRTLLLWIPALVAFAAMLARNLLHSGTWLNAPEWTLVRLTPSWLLLHGFPIYEGTQNDPVFGYIYGPVSAFYYLPAVLFSLPMPALAVGVTLTFCGAFGALLLVLWCDARARSVLPALPLALLVASLVAFAWVDLSTIGYSLYTIGSDVPGLLLIVLATLALRRHLLTGGWLWLGAAALASALAFYARQQGLLAVPVLGLLLILQPLGWRTRINLLVTWGLLCGGALILLGLLFPLLVGAPMWEHMLWLPSLHPMNPETFFPSDFPFGPVVMMTLLLATFAAAWLLADWRGGCGDDLLTAGLIWQSAWLPATIYTATKAGAGLNHWLPFVWFWLLNVSLILQRAAAPREANVVFWKRWRGRLVIAGLVVSSLVSGWVEQRVVRTKHVDLQRWRDNTATRLWAKWEAAPGSFYAPSYPLLHLDREGVLRPFHYAVREYQISGLPAGPRRAQWDYAPEVTRLVGSDFFQSMQPELYPNYRLVHGEPGLWVYERTGPPPDPPGLPPTETAP
ncbi:MAG: hypothetical protein AAGK14_05720 [Verrucomicrobiota bacterium]